MGGVYGFSGVARLEHQTTLPCHKVWVVWFSYVAPTIILEYATSCLLT